ncbi:hypothetical protein B0H17DRAFT_1078883 [Mycena rosella]|uniref:Uncharacterized protein n=1 Tax=Mycena rosella TaxID=1033263 RepID=A0AAD7D479_MYCRO|nr:hypothetical protein B0H17DRAFT_1078883 [Mycena rosella]
MPGGKEGVEERTCVQEEPIRLGGEREEIGAKESNSMGAGCGAPEQSNTDRRAKRQGCARAIQDGGVEGVSDLECPLEGGLFRLRIVHGGQRFPCKVEAVGGGVFRELVAGDLKTVEKTRFRQEGVAGAQPPGRIGVVGGHWWVKLEEDD